MGKNIEYRNGRFFEDGEPMFLLGAEYQYYRDLASNWKERLIQIRESGANTVTFYVPWRHHLVYGRSGEIEYDFQGRTSAERNLVEFMSLCEEQGLYMIAKPGPFVHSELNIGGLPDMVSPSFNPSIECVRMCRDERLVWDYDDTLMPSPHDQGYDGLVRDWLGSVSKVLKTRAAPSGGLIAVQLLDETLYCTSNSPPWEFGYEAASVKKFHDMLAEEYGTIAAYNESHGTALPCFSLVKPPEPEPDKPVALTPKELLAYMDWCRFQWRIRRQAYERYKQYLGMDVPYLSNFAGITPPIEENVPGKEKQDQGRTGNEAYAGLYPEWWFAQNRIDLDKDVYNYGMISWLGVAAYGVDDAGTMPSPESKDDKVLCRYINTARRAHGINMEENWGFSKLYHPLSEYPFVPVFQTLVSVAGGCTGYVVFTAVKHAHWPDQLDRITKKKTPFFPHDAPIGPKGETGPMYEAMCLLNTWFRREGQRLLKAGVESQVCFALQPDMAAVSSFVPGPSQWKLQYRIPRLGAELFEPMSWEMTRLGMAFDMVDLPAADDETLSKYRAVIVPSGFFMSRQDQQTLAKALARGTGLLMAGEPPVLDERMEPCTILKEAMESSSDRCILMESHGSDMRMREHLFRNLNALGVEKNIEVPDGLVALAWFGPDKGEVFLFFFHLSSRENVEKEVTVKELKVRLVLGSRNSGVLHLKDGKIISYLVKARNEFEGTTSKWSIETDSTKAGGLGDRVWFQGG